MEARKVEKKKPAPSLVVIFRLIETPCAGQTIKKPKNRTADRSSLSASYAARPSRDHLATDSVRVKLSSLSATAVSPVTRLT